MADEPEVDPIADKPVEADENAVPVAIDPSNPAHSDERFAYLPTLVADEYGINPEEANLMIRTGKIFIDDEEQKAQTLYVAEEDLIGKTIRVEGDIRTVQFTFRGPQRDRYTGDRFSK